MSSSVRAVAVNRDDSFLNGNSEGKENNYPHALFAADVALWSLPSSMCPHNLICQYLEFMNKL